jgi:hypothetical protein
MFTKNLVLIIAILTPLFLTAARPKEKLDLEINSYRCPDIAAVFKGALLQDHSKIVVALSDGSQWIIASDRPEETLSEISSKWHEGDDIRVGTTESEKYKEKYILKNVRNSRVYLADMDSVCIDPSQAYFIERIDEHGYAIITQDGSEWAIGWLGSFATQRWRKGDRIIINKSSYHDWQDYLLINADTGTDAWASLINWK